MKTSHLWQWPKTNPSYLSFSSSGLKHFGLKLLDSRRLGSKRLDPKLSSRKHRSSPIRYLFLGMSVCSPLLLPFLHTQAQAQVAEFCQLPEASIEQKKKLLAQGLQGDRQAQLNYQNVIAKDRTNMLACRQRSWLKNQALWLRLYECDLNPGVLESLLDRIVGLGYNQIYVEVFYSGQVLLPQSSNRTPWTSVVRSPQFANRDLLAEVIQKGQERGLETYAWLFSMNYGYQYGTRPDRQDAIARNGKGQTSLDISAASDTVQGDANKIFVDPYSPIAQQDYANMLQEVLRRRPKGVLFDYIRYPKQSGGASIASRSSDLWIYGNAAWQALINRGLNQKGRAVINHYLKTGTIGVNDLAAADRMYTTEDEPTWQGRSVSTTKKIPIEQRVTNLRWDLWLLTVAHAYQGVVDFLNRSVVQAQSQGITSGAVFFPDANRKVGQGYDSRMQPWDQFSRNMEWHTMAYGVCGNDTSCITNQVKRVTDLAPGQPIRPVIAGAWGRSVYNRPSLEQQMYAIRQVAPQVQSMSHFDFSWQDPVLANQHRSCKVALIN